MPGVIGNDSCSLIMPKLSQLCNETKQIYNSCITKC
jgi:hypothetical protein